MVRPACFGFNQETAGSNAFQQVAKPSAEAEAFLAGVFVEEGLWESHDPIPQSAFVQFGALVAGAVRPIGDGERR